MAPGAGGTAPGAGGTAPGAGGGNGGPRTWWKADGAVTGADGAVTGAGEKKAARLDGAVESLQIKRLLRCFPSAGHSFPAARMRSTSSLVMPYFSKVAMRGTFPARMRQTAIVRARCWSRWIFETMPPSTGRPSLYLEGLAMFRRRCVWVLIGQSDSGAFILARTGRRRRVHHLHHAFSIRGVAGAGQKAFETRRV